MVFRWRQLHLEQSLLDSATLLQSKNDENGDYTDISVYINIYQDISVYISILKTWFRLKEKMPCQDHMGV